MYIKNYQRREQWALIVEIEIPLLIKVYDGQFNKFISVLNEKS